MSIVADLPGETLVELLNQSGLTQAAFSKRFNLDYDQFHSKVSNARQRAKRGGILLPQSIYPQYNAPLEMEGDAVVYFDFEAPFYHADFVNHVMELGDKWGIKQAIFGGDVLHFDSLSQWEASWIASKPVNSITEDKELELRQLASDLPDNMRSAIDGWLQSVNRTADEDCTELATARRSLEIIGQLYDRCDFVIGNHDDRFLRALNSPLLPSSLLDFIKLDPKKWRIGPYYFSRLFSNKQTFQIEHPKSASANTAVRLADKYECHALVGHSHLQSQMWSTSGKYHAIMAGCCVDETRLPYAAQRHTNRPAHKLGAVIVRGGYPWLLTEHTDWEALKRA